ncbi:hypothetical protein RRG08_057774 [Elysia crispata]|uniref:Uncharacterized protein n=1 Tax=Elysia crispata TaxID=231223 RepID=A0AAE1B4P2_9GAST|nr:hypothetical protein RRG08_057774 [Elysia crispata]
MEIEVMTTTPIKCPGKRRALNLNIIIQLILVHCNKTALAKKLLYRIMYILYLIVQPFVEQPGCRCVELTFKSENNTNIPPNRDLEK